MFSRVYRGRHPSVNPNRLVPVSRPPSGPVPLLCGLRFLIKILLIEALGPDCRALMEQLFGKERLAGYCEDSVGIRVYGLGLIGTITNY